MAKTLTASAVARLKPDRDCREVSDGGCPGLRLSIQPSGHGHGSCATSARTARPPS